MWLSFLLCFLLAQHVVSKEDVVVYNETNQPGAQYYNGRNLEIPIGAESTVQLLQRWHDQAFSGLFSAFANQRVKNSDDRRKGQLEKCSKDAESPTVQAKCIVDALLDKAATKKPKNRKPSSRKFKTITTSSTQIHSKLSERAAAKLRKYAKKRAEKEAKITVHPVEKWVGGFKVRRAKRTVVVQRSNFTLLSKDGDRSPLGIVAKQLAGVVRAIKNKNDTTPWSTTVLRLREKAKKILWEKEFEKQIRKRFNLLPNGERAHKPKKKSNLRRTAGRFTDNPAEDLLFDKIDEYENKENQTSEEKAMRSVVQLLRDGLKLSLMLTGQNVTDFDQKTVKLASPRIMPVVPEEPDNNTISLLSPSLFSLHNEGTDVVENLTSIEHLLNVLPKDQDDWLNLIVEAGGINDQVNVLDNAQDDRTERFKRKTGLNGRPMYFTRENVTDVYGDFEKRKIDTHEQLITGLSPQQLNEMSTVGYTFMTKEQLYFFYGPSSPFNSSEALHRLTALHGNITDQHIEHDLRVVSQMKDFSLRQKDITLSPVITTPLVFASVLMSQPIVLSPVVLSPVVLSPAVLGPVILSPWVFVPVILSPRVLSPLILNPLIFSPIILSPLVLHPLILSPGVFNPVILSPLVLSPLILSPQVFTPLILSPMVLNPLILNPAAGGPLILSPFVLSPLLWSPQFLFAVVLSPYALSPLIESKLILSSVVLSPSWLS